jgi:prevent-host-death family protein
VKSKILSLLDQVADGEEIEITKHGRTIARLVPAAGSASLRGKFAGVATSAASDDDLFSIGEEWESA